MKGDGQPRSAQGCSAGAGIEGTVGVWAGGAEEGKKERVRVPQDPGARLHRCLSRAWIEEVGVRGPDWSPFC